MSQKSRKENGGPTYLLDLQRLSLDRGLELRRFLGNDSLSSRGGCLFGLGLDGLLRLLLLGRVVSLADVLDEGCETG
jgi:hypothetical protein